MGEYLMTDDVVHELAFALFCNWNSLGDHHDWDRLVREKNSDVAGYIEDVKTLYPMIEAEVRDRIFAELIEAANRGGVEADISWYSPDDTIRSEYLTAWLSEQQAGEQ